MYDSDDKINAIVSVTTILFILLIRTAEQANAKIIK